MRRMYSEQELTKVIQNVFEQELEDGALDDKIASAVDAYLIENPVDITALEGQTIAPSVVNATTSISAPTINGESSPSVKPIYYHPIYMADTFGTYKCRVQLAILDNQATAYTKETLLAKIKALCDIGAIINCNGAVDPNESKFFNSYMILKSGGAYKMFYFASDSASLDSNLVLDTLFEQETFGIVDGVNKIN